jgi:hypothetical protein
MEPTNENKLRYPVLGMRAPCAQLHRWPVSVGMADASHHWVLRGHLVPAAKADRVKPPPERSPISKAISQAIWRIATVL